jgi:hypothetical protein
MQDDDIPEGLMQAILLPLIEELLPVVGNDKDRAWQSAEAATMSFNPQTLIEFRLAVRVALFNIQANKLTAGANAPSLTPSCAIRMRLCALSYAREADKAERRLEKLQAVRMEEEKQQPDPEGLEAEIPRTEPPEKATSPATSPATAQAATPIPAYKQLKQERRLAKQRERAARKALAEALAQDSDLLQTA